MSSQIINGKSIRPSFNFNGGDTFGNDEVSAQLLESIRNVLESIDGHLALLRSRYNCSETLAIPHTLKKIEENTRKRKRTKK